MEEYVRRGAKAVKMKVGVKKKGAGFVMTSTFANLTTDEEVDARGWRAPDSPFKHDPTVEALLTLDGRLVIPGFVDSHTHLVFAGDRAAEFAARMAEIGQPYELEAPVTAGFYRRLLFLRRRIFQFLLLPVRHEASNLLLLQHVEHSTLEPLPRILCRAHQRPTGIPAIPRHQAHR